MLAVLVDTFTCQHIQLLSVWVIPSGDPERGACTHTLDGNYATLLLNCIHQVPAYVLSPIKQVSKIKPPKGSSRGNATNAARPAVWSTRGRNCPCMEERQTRRLLLHLKRMKNYLRNQQECHQTKQNYIANTFTVNTRTKR